MAITLNSITPSILSGAGGVRIDIDGDFSGMLGDSFRVHIGSAGSSSDPACYSGVRDQGSIIHPINTSTIRCYTPILDPTGGPYDVYVQNISNPDSGTLAAAVTALPQQYFDSVFALRRPFPPIFYMGPRNEETLENVGSNTNQQKGNFEGVSAAIGGQDAQIGGLRMTRLTALAAEGDTSISVENVLDWPESGQIGIGNTRYTYSSRTNTLLSGIEAVRYGATVTGTLKAHPEGSMVVDLSRSWSALDRARRAMLVEYAEGEDLNALGRNLGVLRYPFLESDDVFREIIKAVAYNPKGTVYGLEEALTALVGAGNFTIFEDLIAFPNTVFIRLSGTALTADEPYGKAFMSTTEHALMTSATEVDIDGEVVDRGAIASVQIAGEEINTPTRDAYPTAQSIEDYDGDTGTNPWTVSGGSEGVDVVLTSDPQSGYIEFQTSTPTQYEHDSRLLQTSQVEFEIDLRPSAAVGAEFQVSLSDDSRDIAFRFQTSGGNPEVGLYDTNLGAYLGTPTQVSTEYAAYTLRWKSGGPVRLYRDGAEIGRADYSDFASTSNAHLISWGQVSAVASNYRITAVALSVRQTDEQWHSQGASGAVNSADADRFDVNVPGFFVAGDAGKIFQILDSGVVNAQGGNNNGRWVIDTVVDDERIDLTGPDQENATLQSAFPKRITIPTSAPAFHYPDDLGKEIVLSGSGVGNDGTYVIDKLLEPGTFTDLASFDTNLPAQTNICEVVSASFATETGLDWKLQPVFTTESGLGWILSDSGDISGQTLTLRQSIPLGAGSGADVVKISYSQVLSAQVLLDILVTNELLQEVPDVIYSRYPFYLSDPYAYVREYADSITAAGVIPEFETE